MFEILNINLRSPVMAMLYLWFYNDLVFYPAGISPLYLGLAVEVAKKNPKTKIQKLKGEKTSSATLSFFFFFNLDEVIYL